MFCPLKGHIRKLDPIFDSQTPCFIVFNGSHFQAPFGVAESTPLAFSNSQFPLSSTIRALGTRAGTKSLSETPRTADMHPTISMVLPNPEPWALGEHGQLVNW